MPEPLTWITPKNRGSRRGGGGGGGRWKTGPPGGHGQFALVEATVADKGDPLAGPGHIRRGLGRVVVARWVESDAN